MDGSILLRLAGQLDCLPDLVSSTTPQRLHQRSGSGKWSAHENLAHLLRHHEIMMARMDRILSEDSPELPRYSAEEDPEWPRYAGLETEEMLFQLRAVRGKLIAVAKGLTASQMMRVGLHSRMGAMPLSVWLEFFLLHEGHHLYLTFLRVHGA